MRPKVPGDRQRRKSPGLAPAGLRCGRVPTPSPDFEAFTQVDVVSKFAA